MKRSLPKRRKKKRWRRNSTVTIIDIQTKNCNRPTALEPLAETTGGQEVALKLVLFDRNLARIDSDAAQNYEWTSAREKPTIPLVRPARGSDQAAHSRSLIRVFADRICILQHPGYPKRDKWEPFPYWVDNTGWYGSLLVTQVLLKVLSCASSSEEHIWSLWTSICDCEFKIQN